MNAFQTTEDLYKEITKYLTYKHQLNRYGSYSNIDITEVNGRFLRIRDTFDRRFSKSFHVSYTEPFTIKSAWRMHINERSA